MVISLVAAADDAWAGIRFRTQLPTAGAADVHDAYQAAGYSLNVNKFGGVQLLRQQHGLSTSLWSGRLSQLGNFDVNSVGGVSLEVRTHNGEPGWMQVVVNGQAVAVVNDADPLLGEHNGLVASTTSGRIRFGNREFYDVGYEHQTTYTLHSDGKLDLDMEASLAPGVTTPRKFYRAGQHAYVDPSLFAKGDRAIWGDAVDGRVSDPHILVRNVSPAPGGLTSLWVGNERGDLGLSATVRHATLNGEPAVGTHALIQDAHGVMALHLNTLPESANREPVWVNSTSLKATFWTRAQ